MASTVLAQRAAVSLLSPPTHLPSQKSVCRAVCVPVYARQRSTGKSFQGAPLRTRSSAPFESRRQLPAVNRVTGVRAQSSLESGNTLQPAETSETSGLSETPPEDSAPLRKLAVSVAGAVSTLGEALKQQWWGKDGSAAKRIGTAFLFAALPIVLSGVVGVPAALAAPGASKYQRNQTSRGILYFAMMLLVSVKQVLFIFRGMLLLRIVLTWFPNLPWDKHPLKASRELTDPYLNLFKSVVPVVGNLDLSPLAAFAFMGFFESLIGVNEKSLKESTLWRATS